MTSHVARLYALAVSLLVLFLFWAMIAARPWGPAAAGRDPRLAALDARERRLRAEAIRVQRIVAHRFAVYREQLRRRQAAIARVKRQNALAATRAAATPRVRIVSLPPLTITRSS
jgi:hypothetical protein